jgi:spore maturation protein CgeB
MLIEAIFLVGNFLPGSLERSYQRAFEAIGVRTHVFPAIQFRQELNWVLRNRLAHRLTIRSNLIREKGAWRFNRSLEEAVLQSNARALLVVKGDFVMRETLHSLRSKGVRIALYYPDNPFPPHSCNRPETLPAARETDLYLIWSERLVKALKETGVSNPAFLPFAWDSEAFPYQGSQPQGTWPGVIFLGGWDKEREEFLEQVASKIPLRIYGPDYWGTRTRARSRARQCWQGHDLRLDAAARVIRESAVCLNILRTQHVIDGMPDGLIMRHFEVPGSGGFLLSTRGGGATALFHEGESGEYFSSVSECVEKAQYYIGNQVARRRLADTAHSHVASEHQYTDRARQILQLLNECR